MHQISIEKQSLIEDVLAAHFTAEKKLSPNERRSTELHRLCQEVETESVREMLMKCVKPEMLYYFVQTSFDSFTTHQVHIEEGLNGFDESIAPSASKTTTVTTFQVPLSPDKKDGRSNTSAKCVTYISGTTSDTNNHKLPSQIKQQVSEDANKQL